MTNLKRVTKNLKFQDECLELEYKVLLFILWSSY